MEELESGEVLFTAETSISTKKGEHPDLSFASPDALLLPGWVAEAAKDPDIRIEPAWKVSIVYGMSCAVGFVVPAAYYLAVRFAGDFEEHGAACDQWRRAEHEPGVPGGSASSGGAVRAVGDSPAVHRRAGGRGGDLPVGAKGGWGLETLGAWGGGGGEGVVGPFDVGNQRLASASRASGVDQLRQIMAL